MADRGQAADPTSTIRMVARNAAAATFGGAPEPVPADLGPRLAEAARTLRAARRRRPRGGREPLV
ncbi:hypothetical protein H7U32_06750 [Bifidobacterium pullorum subsp. saeculare]|uniref:Uncharacterized protein n=1 Tax=Bifidobacterium pullorum subsp. saeculare TaxID=78257 RepID=A0A938WYN0_9BIFI|nr:hypothetical protein [Bifidobacterium pullorum]MBM6700005.1 hypothetical protein [Bifidobacterium pullorum subsp. saeculare]